MRLRFLELVKVLEQVPFDDYNLVITGLNFTKLIWMVRLIILMHLTGMNAESEP
jgi:hypothetical protein